MRVKNMLLTGAGIAMLSMMSAFASIAATQVNQIVLDITPEDMEDMKPGDLYSALEPREESAGYYVSDYETSSTTSIPEHSYTYTSIEIEPETGYQFTGTTSVTVKGAYAVTIKSRSNSKIEIKASAYPFYVLRNPSNVDWDKKGTQTNGTKTYAKITKGDEYADSYSLVITWENKDGEEHTTTQSVKKSSVDQIDVSSYNRNNRTITKLAAQAKKGSKTGDNYTANSKFVTDSGSVDDDLSWDTPTFSIPTTTATNVGSQATGSYTSTSSQTSTPSSNSTPGTANAVSGWMQMGGNWYYIRNGVLATGWVNPSGHDWYYMGQDAKMQAGLITDGSYMYYLNMQHDGTYGKMLTGWQVIGSAYYYFNQYSGNGIPYGAMYVNKQTPDGHFVNGYGVMIR
ncbi:MAG: hypothetical protein SPL49_09305 [Oribacterium sp.]|nr:hypothetical protein [Oribacterium sp.]